MKRNPRKQSISSYLPFILIGVGAVLVLGVLVWQLTQSQAGGTANSSAGGAIVNSGESSYPEIKRVTLEQAKSAFDSKEAVFVDVRDSGSYNIGHVPGALNIPLSEIEAGTANLSQLKPDQWIITYCT